jgi:hypothetical protein
MVNPPLVDPHAEREEYTRVVLTLCVRIDERRGLSPPGLNRYRAIHSPGLITSASADVSLRTRAAHACGSWASSGQVL